MASNNLPQCSHDPKPNENQSTVEEIDKTSRTSAETPQSFILESNSEAGVASNSETGVASNSEAEVVSNSEARNKNLKLLQNLIPLVIRPSCQTPIMCQPRSSLQSPLSLTMPAQPPTLFIQALSKLNESSLNLVGLSNSKTALDQITGYRTGDITPPDSLTSAPPSYSFVLRQMAARRRPRLMGTFIPSPSFVQHTPPPNYATAFDIYVDNRIPPPPQRVYRFGFASMPAICPECGYTGMTVVTSKITLCTHLCACILCILCCWICVPLPYILRSCKDVYHYCRNCRTFLGLYCPTNPDTSFTTS